MKNNKNLKVNHQLINRYLQESSEQKTACSYVLAKHIDPKILSKILKLEKYGGSTIIQRLTQNQIITAFYENRDVKSFRNWKESWNI